MPAPTSASAMNPIRQIRASTPLYSASPPQTPPRTLLVVLRRRCVRCGAKTGAGGPACAASCAASCGDSGGDCGADCGGDCAAPSEEDCSGCDVAVMATRLACP